MYMLTLKLQLLIDVYADVSVYADVEVLKTAPYA